MMKTFITRRGKGQGKTKKGRKALSLSLSSAPINLQEKRDSAKMNPHGGLSTLSTVFIRSSVKTRIFVHDRGSKKAGAKFYARLIAALHDEGMHRDACKRGDHDVPTIHMLLQSLAAAPAPPKSLFREGRLVATGDMGAEAPEALVGNSLLWVETALRAEELVGRTAAAVGDTVQTAWLSLVNEDESIVENNEAPQASETIVTRPMRTLETPDSPGTLKAPHAATSRPSPCHLLFPDPLVPIAELSSGMSIQGSTESPTYAELKLRQAAVVSFQHFFHLIANTGQPHDADLPGPESLMLAPITALRWSAFASKLLPNRLAAHQPRTPHDVGFAVRRGLRRASEADDVSTLIKKLAAKTTIHISTRPNQVIWKGVAVRRMSDKVSRARACAGTTYHEYAVNLIRRRRVLSKFFELWT